MVSKPSPALSNFGSLTSLAEARPLVFRIGAVAFKTLERSSSAGGTASIKKAPQLGQVDRSFFCPTPEDLIAKSAVSVRF
jgi:hypothetical protein